MSDTTQRVLELLGLMQSRAIWQSSELAEKLGVTERTVRRDIVRLRELGYPVESSRGLDGGYRLGAGRHLPPLLLNDEEAVALVASLRMTALSGTDEFGEAALRALTKLDHVMPSHLRAVAFALDSATEAIPGKQPAVDLGLLQQLATSQHERRLVRFSYLKPSDSTATAREVEPARLMTQGNLWYLQGFDRTKDDWRVFRLDRITDFRATTWSFTPRKPPPAGFTGEMASRYRCVARVEVEATPARVTERVPAPFRLELEATDRGCRFLTGGPDWDDLAWHLLWVCRDLESPMYLGSDDDGDQLRDALRRIGADAFAAADAGRAE